MAIINSTVMGKSSGKIGNVVTCVLKGQTIAKQRNSSPANPKTALQVNSRVKMSNAVLAWQYLAVFMQFASPLKKSTESVYNAFVRLTKNLFSEEVATSGSLAAYMLYGKIINVSNWAKIGSIVATSLTIDTLGLPYVVGTKLAAFSYDSSTGENELKFLEVTESMWNAGLVTGVNPSFGSNSWYLYNTAANKISDIKFI